MKEFDIMKNIEVCKEAIDYTGLLSKGQKSVLKYMLAFDSEGGVTADTIKNSSVISRQAANVHLKHLTERGFVNRNKDRVFIYYPEKIKLQQIVEEYRISKKLKKT